jgi:hypothetical protein
MIPFRDFREPIALADGQAVILDCRGMSKFTVIGSGTLTATRVNTRPPRTAGPAATADVVPAASSSTYSVTTGTAIAVDWPFVRVLTSGAAATVAVV